MKKLCLILFFICSLPICSQERSFTHIGLPQGLPQETVLGIAQDTLGIVWLATQDGLIEYDGTHFKTPPVDDKTGLDVSSYRYGVVKSFKRFVLGGSGQKGLFVYDVVNKTTRQLGSPTANCTAIFTTKDGFFVGNYDGSIHYFTSEFKESKFIIEGIIPERLTSIALYNQHIFVGTEDGKILSAPWKEDEKTLHFKMISGNNGAINFLKIANDKLLAGTQYGLFFITPEKLNLEQYPLPFCNENLQHLSVTDVVFWEEYTFLATTTGLIEFKNGSCEVTYTAKEKDDTSTVNSNGINDLFLADGNLLIGHITLDITEITPPNVFEVPSKNWSLANPSVFAVCEGRTHLFVGTSSGLIISDKQDFNEYRLFEQFKLRGIAEDNSGNIWLVSGNGGFVLPKGELEKESPNFIALPVDENDALALPESNLRSVFLDRNGAIWITTFSKGLCQFKGNISSDDLRFNRYAFGKEAANLPSPLTLSTLHHTENSYWISTQKGLSRMKINQNGEATFRNYFEEDGLATNGVLSSYVQKNGTLWVASRKGLNKYLPENDAFIAYGKRDGLSNTFVYNIVEDKEENLWLTTNGGFFRFNPTTEQFSNYSPKDGVQSTEFNLGALFSNLKTGKIYAGGIAGLNVFDPSRVAALDKQSKLLFTTIESPNFSFKEKNVGTDEVQILHDDFPLTFSFAALDYRPSKNISYQYRLLPQNQDWNSVTSGNEIQLVNLAPGDYTLQVRGLSRNIPWKSEPLTTSIKVIPPWYRTVVAYILYGLIIGAIIFTYFRISWQRKLAGQEAHRLQELDAMKSRFITNITHEFRTPLTIILGYAEVLKQKLRKKSGETEDVETIEKNGEHLLNLVNQMLDLAKVEQGRLKVNYEKANISVFIKAIFESFTSPANQKGIELKFEDTLKDPALDFDAEKVRQIVSNLLSNAIKFTENGVVQVTLLDHRESFIINVSDTGPGISEKDQSQIFERFYQVENTHFKIAQGTGIGLALTKELVELMNGSIKVKSIETEGTTFTVTLPITRAATPKDTVHLAKPVLTDIVVPDVANPTMAKDASLVLIVEDNLDMARYIGNCFQNSFKTIHAKNGKEGFEKAKEVIPDVIISDVMMPIMDGFEMVQKLQGEQATNHIPLILLTSKAEIEDRLKGIDSGADVYLTKPFNQQELKLRVDKLIEKRTQLQKKYQEVSLLEYKKVKPKKLDKNEVFIKKVMASVEENLFNSEFNSTELAQKMALSESQLYRKLKAITNTSTAIFIRNIRLEASKEMLLNTPKTISEIAFEVGFNDPNWFTKSFKETFGKTPSEFRNTL